MSTLQMPERVELEQSTYTSTSGRFTLQPLEKGFGVTIGNSMRRVLLSSLPGTAITAIRVEGIQHEFSTIKGMVEDVADFILNIKQVRIKPINKKATKVTVQVKGPGKLTAGDIQNASAEIEILNPTHHLASLNKDANFEIEFRLGRGKGYVPAEENKSADQPLERLLLIPFSHLSPTFAILLSQRVLEDKQISKNLYWISKLMVPSHQKKQ